MHSLICSWTNGWANNGDADYLRRHRAHYDVTAMYVHHVRILAGMTVFCCPLYCGTGKPKNKCDVSFCNILSGTQHIKLTYITHDDVIKWKHFRRNWPFVRGIHRSPVNSTHKGQWGGALISSFICALNKRLSKQSWGWWFETPSRLLWYHCNVKVTYIALALFWQTCLKSKS